MTKDKALTNKIIDFSNDSGIDIIGFADSREFQRFPEKNRPENYLQNAGTVIIIGLFLFDISLDAWTWNQKRGKSYHFMDAVIENLCHKMNKFISLRGYDSEIISYEPGLFLKDSAALAGIGPIGRNNLLLTESYGSQVRLRALVTTAPLACGDPILESKYCKGCNKCATACPADAFSENKYNKNLCYNYSTTHLKELSQYTSIWCNACIDACPVGKF